MEITSGSTDREIYFVAVDETDLKTRETGLSSFTVYRSRNGGSANAWTTPTVTEIDATNMPGIYSLLVDEDTTLTNGIDQEEMAVHITHAGMAPVTRSFSLVRLRSSGSPSILYVDGANGDDSDDGKTLDTAKATIASAITAAVDGDIIRVMAGTYNETLTVAKPLTLETTASALINGDSNTNVITVNTDHFTIKGFNITANGTGIVNTTSGIFASARNFIRVIDCNITARMRCLEFSNCRHIVVDNCRLSSKREAAYVVLCESFMATNTFFKTDGTWEEAADAIAVEIENANLIGNTSINLLHCQMIAIGTDSAQYRTIGVSGEAYVVGGKIAATVPAGGTGECIGAFSSSTGQDSRQRLRDVAIFTQNAGTGDTNDLKVESTHTDAECRVTNCYYSTTTGNVIDEVRTVQTTTDKFVFTVSNQVDANIQYINDVQVAGDGSATPWGPV